MAEMDDYFYEAPNEQGEEVAPQKVQLDWDANNGHL
jgi:hypothetical protein